MKANRLPKDRVRVRPTPAPPKPEELAPKEIDALPKDDAKDYYVKQSHKHFVKEVKAIDLPVETPPGIFVIDEGTTVFDLERLKKCDKEVMEKLRYKPSPGIKP